MKTKVAQTSIDCHHKNIATGKYSRQETIVLDRMSGKWSPAGITRSEMAALTGLGINIIAGRVNSLIGKQVLKVDGKKICSISGEPVGAVFLA